MNLHAGNGAKGQYLKTFCLTQTPTEVTYQILACPTTQAQYTAYCEWLRGFYAEPDWVRQPWNEAPWDGKPEWVEQQIVELGEFLQRTPNAKFFAA